MGIAWSADAHMTHRGTQVVVTLQKGAKHFGGCSGENKMHLYCHQKVCTGSSVYILWLLAWCFSGNPKVGACVSLNIFAFYGGTFHPIGLPYPAFA